MALITKKQLIEECLEQDTLRTIADDYELAVRSNAGHQALAVALMKKRSIKLDEILSYASKPELQASCEWLEIAKTGSKETLIARILSEEEQDRMADDFNLEGVEQDNTPQPKKKATKKGKAAKGKANQANEVISYRHDDKRKNNPPVGMVDVAGDSDEQKTTWAYDPHLDPALQFDSSRSVVEKLIDDALASGNESTMRDALEQLKRMQAPYLNWAGKAEGTSFEVDTVSVHVHERIDPATILAGLQKRFKDSKGKDAHKFQSDLFNAPFENLPLREAVDFYKHDKDWSNRLISGDSLLVMNSLLQKESMAGQLQTVYFDPPYGIKYGSNFQPFVNKRDVKDRSDADLTKEPEMIKAFRDTWELGVHSYLTYLKDRLLLAKELLSQSGSIFLQISDENLHYVRSLLDEVFGKENFVSLIFYKKTGYVESTLLPSLYDLILWYAVDINKVKYNQLYVEKNLKNADVRFFDTVEELSSYRRRLSKDEKSKPQTIKNVGKLMARNPLVSPGWSENLSQPIIHNGIKFECPPNAHYKTTPNGIGNLQKANRLIKKGNVIRFAHYLNDLSVTPVVNHWADTGTGGFSGDEKVYVVQTDTRAIERCILMTSDPGDLVLDPTCGSGSTALVAEKLGRRWITCDTSRVSITLAKQRLMTASFDYFELKYPNEGLKGGFIYN
ncbi:MAG: adenine-specific DNA-methyltransferase [Oleispira sp.]|jgi:adenine-specific DNA-methyltransferase